MFIMGGVALAACLVLPPWLEARELKREQVEARRRIAELEERLTRASRQIEHLRNDPAYIERIGREEFGIETPGVDVVPVAVSEAPIDPTDAEAEPDDKFSVALERATRENPVVSVFVLKESRPIVMGMSGALLAAALALLIRGSPSRIVSNTGRE